ncbi:MAG: nucleotidyltransferase domain-containing protein [Clostridia bacterium]|nr:nucleotidyltransferase domain-containing protein [Clostridia bacterium]
MIQQEYKPLIECVLENIRRYFGKRLVAVYLHGSIEKGDAIPGISDLDLMVIIDEKQTMQDDTWLKAFCGKLCVEYVSLIEEAHISLMSSQELAENPFASFALRYNASLIEGTDIAGCIDADMATRYMPDKWMAKRRLQFARNCFDEALAGKTPACTGPLPADSRYISRKFARYFVVVEGAYFLMTKNAFTSFHKDTVLEQLRRHTNGYEETLDAVQGVLNNPEDVELAPQRLLEKIKPMVFWLFEEIERA